SIRMAGRSPIATGLPNGCRRCRARCSRRAAMRASRCRSIAGRSLTEAAEGWSQWPAPAKLNLFLHIVGRRADGYHLLQTVFQLLDWGDEVRLRLRSDGQVLRSGSG